MPGPPTVGPGMAGPAPGPPLPFGVSTGWSRGTSGGVVYMFDGGIANSSAAGWRISRFGVDLQPTDAKAAASRTSQTPFMGRSPKSSVRPGPGGR